MDPWGTPEIIYLKEEVSLLIRTRWLQLETYEQKRFRALLINPRYFSLT